jgi:4'-phosphopantetheinyl transferase
MKYYTSKINLWYLLTDEISDEYLLAQYRSLMSEQEHNKEQSFRFEKDRHSYMLTRALVRIVLSQFATIAAKDWIFKTNLYGRPEISNDDPSIKEIVFNISHTKGLIILGVTHGNALGVDVENVLHRKAPIEIAKNFFSRKEIEDILSLPEGRQQKRFFQYWTLKEAYIKARGVGLSIPLDQFTVHIHDTQRLRMSMDSCLDEAPDRWRLWQYQLSSKYLIAVCADSALDIDTQIILKKIVPLKSEDLIGHFMLP